MDREKYSVYEIVELGEDVQNVPVVRFVDVETAVKSAVQSTLKPAALIGIISEVMITDGGDHCVFHWVFGRGLVFPTREDVEKSREERARR